MKITEKLPDRAAYYLGAFKDAVRQFVTDIREYPKYRDMYDDSPDRFNDTPGPVDGHNPQEHVRLLNEVKEFFSTTKEQQPLIELMDSDDPEDLEEFIEAMSYWPLGGPAYRLPTWDHERALYYHLLYRHDALSKALHEQAQIEDSRDIPDDYSPALSGERVEVTIPQWEIEREILTARGLGWPQPHDDWKEPTDVHPPT